MTDMEILDYAAVSRRFLHSSRVILVPRGAAMSIVPSSAVTLAGAEQAIRAGIAAAEKSGIGRTF